MYSSQYIYEQILIVLWINVWINKGIEPYVTIFHWDVPQTLEDEYGGWLSRESVYDFFDYSSFFTFFFSWFLFSINLSCNECRRDFTAYADTCFKEFGDRVLHWTTINEANVFALGGYDQGVTPPGRCSLPFGLNCSEGNSPTEPYIAVHNMLLAHASATNLYKKHYQVLLTSFLCLSVCTTVFI